MKIRKARIKEAPAIAKLVNHYAAMGLMLPKNVLAVYEHIREFVVAADDSGTVVGCGALRIMWHDLAEVRSLAIAEEAAGQGLGRRIVDRLIQDARELGLARVFALTYQVEFFQKLGFKLAPKSVFPQKVWLDCRGCPKKQCCDETAVMLILDEARAAQGEAESLRQPFARVATQPESSGIVR